MPIFSVIMPARVALMAETDTNVTTFASKAKAVTGAARARRFRRKAQAVYWSNARPVEPTVSEIRHVEKRNDIKGAVTVERNGSGLDVAAYWLRLFWACARRSFPSRGWCAVPGRAVGRRWNGPSRMEGAKLVTAGWLARAGRATARMASRLVALVAGSPSSNATGV